MTFPSNISACAIAVSILVSTATFADDSFRQHDTHIHGLVELNIAQDGNDLLLEITAPGSDIVGFEHAPQTQDQTQAIQEAMLTLKKPSSLFDINSDANCELTDSYVNQSLSKQSDDEHDHSIHDDLDHSNHDDHDHSSHDDLDHSSHDDHDHSSHDDHDHSSHDDHDHSSHDDHDHSEHGEFTAQYSFSCKNIAQLNEIKLNWFNHFPSTEKISVQAITDKSQQANQLTENNATLKF